MQSHSKITLPSASTTTPAVYGLQGWADLPEGLLHSVVPLLGSIIELLAFAGTCRSWRAAFSSYPSKSTLRTLLPPLLVRPQIIVRSPNLPSRSDDGSKLFTYQVLDPANKKSTLRCLIPREAIDKLHFVGSSYGQLICSRGRNCLVVDVFTGAKVLSPQLPLTKSFDLCYGMLTSRLASPNSHFLVCNAFFLLDWLIGSDFWSKLQLSETLRIRQIVEFNGQFIVEFNGQFIAMDDYRLYTLSLAPQLGMQEIATVWSDNMHGWLHESPWLVVCRGMLLIVGYCFNDTSSRVPVKYKAYRLDMSSEPATWAEVAKLENEALFIGGDVRSPPFACMSPGRWGGRSNCLYYSHSRQLWVLHGLGDDADAVWDDSTDPDILHIRSSCIGPRPEPFWVYPSMFYLDGQ